MVFNLTPPAFSSQSLVESFHVVDPGRRTDRAAQPTAGRSSYFPLSFLQENMQQLILMPLPNVAILGQDPLTGTR